MWLLSVVERVFAASKITSPEQGELIVTQRADYTSSEWSLLTSAVVTVGLGMLAVSGAGLVGRLRELTTLSRRFSALDAHPVHAKRAGAGAAGGFQ